MRRATALVAIALLVGGGCTPDAEAPDPEPYVAPTLEPAAGNVAFGVVGEPSTLDPYHEEAWALTWWAVRPVYRSLYRVDPDGAPVADLAESLEVDGTTARVLLRDAVWSDGTPIVARDVVASLERARPPSNLAGIEGVEAIGRREILLKGEVDDWERELAIMSYVLPGGRFDRKIASGPWRIDTLTPGLKLTYEPNPRAETTPLLKSLTLWFVNSVDILLELLASHRLDAAAPPSTVNLEDRLGASGVEVASASGWERVSLVAGEEAGALSRDRVIGFMDVAAIEERLIRDAGRTAPGLVAAQVSHAVRAKLKVSAPTGDELLEMLHKAVYEQLRGDPITVELVAVDMRTFYGPWQQEDPTDLSLRRVIGAPGVKFPDSVLFEVDSFVAWQPGVEGVVASPTIDGPLWNSETWTRARP